MGECFTGVDDKTEHIFFIAVSKVPIIMCQPKGPTRDDLNAATS